MLGFMYFVAVMCVELALLQVIVISSVLSYESLSYSSYTLGKYSYPHWANVTGWLVAASSMIAVPLVAVYQIITLPGHPKQVRHALSFQYISVLESLML